MELLKEILNQILGTFDTFKIVYGAFIDCFRFILSNNELLARFILLTSIVWFPLLCMLIKFFISFIKNRILKGCD